MSIAKTVINKPTTILIIFVLLLGLSLYIGFQIPIDLIPEINPPYLVVYAAYSGAGPEEVEQNVTRPLESSLINVSNIKRMTSTSSEGVSLVMFEFDWVSDLNEASSEIRDRIEMVKDMLPDGVSTPQLFKFNPSMIPIMSLNISGERPPEDLREIAETQIQPFLEQVNGVASTSLSGGRERIIRVEISQNRLEAYELSLTQISQMLASQNMQIGGGSVGEDSLKYLVRTSGQFESLADIENTVITYKSPAQGQLPVAVRLRDVAEVIDGFRDPSQLVYINGEPGLYLSIQKQSGTNSVEVADAVRARLETLKGNLPAGVELSIMYDSTDMIREVINQVASSAINGIVLAMIVLFVFLRNLQSTFIIGLSIPLSLLITLMVMYFMNLTLNMMTLGGLALGVGMIVDSSIVVLENIYRYREKGSRSKTAAFLGSQEMFTAVMASTLTTICVFLPVVMFRKELDMVGVLFKDLALTIVVSLTSSLIVSLTLVPALTSKYIKLYSRKQKPLKNRLLKGVDGLMAALLTALDNAYKKALAVVLRYKKTMILICFLLFALALMFFSQIGVNFMPNMAGDTVTLNVTLPQGTKLEVTDALIKEWEEIVHEEIEGYREIVTTAGTASMMGASTQSHQGTIEIHLPPVSQRIETPEMIQEKLRPYFDNYLFATFSFAAAQMSMGGSAIDIAIQSDDLVAAQEVGEEIVRLIKDNLPEITDPSLGISRGLPEVKVAIDRDKAYNLGLNVYSVGQEISAAVGGRTATRYRSSGKEYEVMVILQEEDRNTILDLNKLFVMNSLGARIPISSFASLVKTTGPVSINRENQSRLVHVTAGVKPGVPENVAETMVQTLVNEKLVMREGVIIRYEGNWRQTQEMVLKFVAIVIIAIALVFGVMASQFESLKDPFIVLASIPFLAIGIVGIYLIAGRPFSMLTAVGVIMLVGIVVNNGIVLVDYTNLLVQRGLTVTQACIEAGGNRLRPILMTSLTTIFGMLPMALTTGEEAAMIQDIGFTVLGGMISSTLITLFFVPALYAAFNKEKRRRSRYARLDQSLTLPAGEILPDSVH